MSIESKSVPYVDVRGVLTRAEKKAERALEAFRLATASPNYVERLETLEEAYETAKAVLATWEAYEGVERAK